MILNAQVFHNRKRIQNVIGIITQFYEVKPDNDPVIKPYADNKYRIYRVEGKLTVEYVVRLLYELRSRNYIKVSGWLCSKL